MNLTETSTILYLLEKREEEKMKGQIRAKGRCPVCEESFQQIKKFMIEERRKEIKRHAEESLKEYKAGKIKFGSLRDIKTALHED